MAAEPQAIATSELDRLAGGLNALGLAVSGGGDSTALLHMAAEWGRVRGVRISVATVDHGLRDASAAEAAAVGAICAGLALPHAVLRWDHAGGIGGNLMAAARAARMELLADWARAQGLPAIALGHTQDDQAETVLMRLARGAGVDGLSGMAPARMQAGVLWLRPALGVARAALRDWLAARGLTWIDDPTNDDPGFDRIRARHAIAALGLDAALVARSAAALAEARAALAEAAVAATAAATADRGVLRLPASVLDQPAELRRRIIAAALRWITAGGHPPRGDDLGRLIATLQAGGQGTLAGAILRQRRGWIEALREPAACAPMAADGPRAVWDHRWALDGLTQGALLRATGPDDLAGRDWRAAGLPRPAVLAAPAVEDGGRVVLPLLDPGCGIGLTALRGAAELAVLLRAH